MGGSAVDGALKLCCGVTCVFPLAKKRHKIEYIKCSDCSHPGPGGETSVYSRSAVKPGQQ